jgi:peptidoglycan hydrolase-like protein with peptidoglycan-binding domain
MATRVRRVLHGAIGGIHVEELQRALAASDFDPGVVDGVYGPDTAAAVVAYQKARALPADGIVGPETWKTLGGESAGERLASLSLPGILHGATGGEDVRQAQAALSSAGFDPGPMDAVFGRRTERAVREYQKARRLEVDGLVGPETWERLEREPADPTQSVAQTKPSAESAGVPDDTELFSRLSPDALRALAYADGFRAAHGQDKVHMEDLIAGLYVDQDGFGRPFLTAHRIDQKQLWEIIAASTKSDLPLSWDRPEVEPVRALPPLSAHARDALDQARWAADGADAEISSEHLLYGALSVPRCGVIDALRAAGVKREDVRLPDQAEEEPAATTLLEASFNMRIGGQSDQATLQDLLGFKPLVQALHALMNDKRTKLPLAIGVTAPWGGGKSSLMRQLEDLLTHPPPEAADDAPRWYTVWFDAWKYGKSERLWAALAKAIYEQAQRDMPKRKRAQFRRRVERKRQGLLPFLIRGLGPAVVAGGAGLYALAANAPEAGGPLLTGSLAAFIASTGRYWGALSQPFKRAIDSYSSSPSVPDQLGFTPEADAAVTKMIEVLLAQEIAPKDLDEEAIGKLPPFQRPWIRRQQRLRSKRAEAGTAWLRLRRHVAEAWARVRRFWAPERKPWKPQNSLAFFVDDLDRCAPDQVVEVVNAINQIFNSVNGRRCVFVLGMDRDVVAASIEVVYRDTIATLAGHHSELRTGFGLQFLAKLVQLSVAIPRPGDEVLKRYLGTLHDLTADGQVPSTDPPEALVRAAEDLIDLQRPDGPGQVSTVQRKLMADTNLGRRLPGRASTTDIQAAVQEAARRSRAKRLTTDSPDVRLAQEYAVPFLGGNPRQVKRFDNAFRLQLHVASNSDPNLEFTQDQLDVMAKWCAIRLRWPELAVAIDAHEGLLPALEKHANSKATAAPAAAVPKEWAEFAEWFARSDLRRDLRTEPTHRLVQDVSNPLLRVT